MLSVSLGAEIIQQKPFRLLDLPPELWTKICQLRLDADEASATTSPLRPNIKQQQIARVCRITRSELLPYFYKMHCRMVIYLQGVERYVNIPGVTPSNNTINYGAYYLSDRFKLWLRAVAPEYRKYLENVEMIMPKQKQKMWIMFLKFSWNVGFAVVQIGEETVDETLHHRLEDAQSGPMEEKWDSYEWCRYKVTVL